MPALGSLSASPPPPPSARWRSSASSPTTRARPSARCWRPASCSPPRSSGCSCCAAPGACGRCAARDVGIGARARRDRLRRAGRRLLRGARPSRRLAALAARLHVSRDRHRGCRRARPRAASRRTALRPGARLGRARARPGGSRRGRARPASAPCWRWATAVVYSAYILVSQGVAGRDRPAGAQRARLHRRRMLADVGCRRRRRPPSGGRDRGGLRLARRARGRVDRRAPSPSSSPACGSSARRPRRSSRRSSRW